MRQKLLLLAAVFFGILAFVLTYQQIQTEKRRIRGESTTVYLVKLTRDIAQGEEITLSDITRHQEHMQRGSQALSRYVQWRQSKLVIGRKTAISMDKNSFIQWDDLQPPSRKKFGLTSIIPPGERAVSIAVDTTSSVTNLIQPDDRVDVIGTFRFPEMKGDKSIDTLTLTILQNVKILATGNRWGAIADTQPGGGRGSYSTVTLSLSPKEAEMVIFAAQKGRLSLTLRNHEESRFEKDLQNVNFKYLEEHIGEYNEEREQRMRRR